MRTLVCVLTLLFAVGLVAAPAGADVFTFEGTINNGWNVDGNWDIPGYPDDANDKAIIPSGEMVCVGCPDSTGPSLCGDIQVDATAVGAIEIWGEGTTLTISKDSTVNGVILFKGIIVKFRPSLELRGDVEITGSGTISAAGNLTPGSIWSVNGAKKLTIPNGFTIKGSIAINTALENNGLVLVNDADDILWLGDGAKSGGSSGKWKVTAGELHVDCEVTGGAKWILKGGQSTSFIRIESGAVTDALSGDVKLEGGTFQIDDTFCTIGDITATAGADEPMIKVKWGTTATLNAVSCP